MVVSFGGDAGATRATYDDASSTFRRARDLMRARHIWSRRQARQLAPADLDASPLSTEQRQPRAQAVLGRFVFSDFSIASPDWEVVNERYVPRRRAKYLCLLPRNASRMKEKRERRERQRAAKSRRRKERHREGKAEGERRRVRQRAARETLQRASGQRISPPPPPQQPDRSSVRSRLSSAIHRAECAEAYLSSHSIPAIAKSPVRHHPANLCTDLGAIKSAARQRRRVLDLSSSVTTPAATPGTSRPRLSDCATPLSFASGQSVSGEPYLLALGGHHADLMQPSSASWLSLPTPPSLPQTAQSVSLHRNSGGGSMLAPMLTVTGRDDSLRSFMLLNPKIAVDGEKSVEHIGPGGWELSPAASRRADHRAVETPLRSPLPSPCSSRGSVGKRVTWSRELTSSSSSRSLSRRTPLAGILRKVK